MALRVVLEWNRIIDGEVDGNISPKYRSGYSDSIGGRQDGANSSLFLHLSTLSLFMANVARERNRGHFQQVTIKFNPS